MWKLKHTLLAGAILALAAGGVYAQSVIQDDLSGNEAWNAGQGPGGPGSFITSNLVRNSIAKAMNPVSGTFGAGALLALSEGGYVFFTTQPLAAVTLTLPPNPVTDGAKAGFCNATGSQFATTAIAFATSTAQTLSSISIVALSAIGNYGSCVEVTFDRASTTWYRTR